MEPKDQNPDPNTARIDEFINQTLHEADVEQRLLHEAEIEHRQSIGHLIEGARGRGIDVPQEWAEHAANSEIPTWENDFKPVHESQIEFDMISDVAMSITLLKELRRIEAAGGDPEFHAHLVEQHKKEILASLLFYPDDPDWQEWLETVEEVAGESVIAGETLEEKRQVHEKYVAELEDEMNEDARKMLSGEFEEEAREKATQKSELRQKVNQIRQLVENRLGLRDDEFKAVGPLSVYVRAHQQNGHTDKQLLEAYRVGAVQSISDLYGIDFSLASSAIDDIIAQL